MIGDPCDPGPEGLGVVVPVKTNERLPGAVFRVIRELVIELPRTVP